jgi:hypothetical protein
VQHHVLCAVLQDPISTNIPGVETKGPPCLLNIMPLVNPNINVANHITVSWNTEYRHDYAIAGYLVRILKSSDSLQRLKT